MQQSFEVQLRESKQLVSTDLVARSCEKCADDAAKLRERPLLILCQDLQQAGHDHGAQPYAAQ